jgi:hypothetical protein
MRKFCIAVAILSCLIFNSFTGISQTAGFNNTYLILQLNGGGNTYYDLNAATANPDFEGTNLGTFISGTSSLIYKGAEHNIYKCGGCNLSVTRLNYNIHLTGNAAGTFLPNNVGYTSGFVNGCGGEDQLWSTAAGNTDLIAGLSPGNYTMEVYSDATITCGTGTAYASNSAANYKATFTVAVNTWLGVTNSWTTSSSWSGLVVPAAGSYVSIPVTAISPIITSAQACYNLDIAPGAILTIAATPARLSLGGAVTNTGLIDATAGALELSGTAPQTITSAMFKDKTIKNLIISNDVSIGGTPNADTLKITGTVSFGASSKTFTTNNNLTLVSDATGTAGIGDLTAAGTLSGNVITGNANVERYISAGRKWRFIAMNSEGSQTIQDSWMEKQVPGVQGPAGYGQWITDPVAANVDALSYTTSMKYYTSSGYVSITDPATFDIKSQPAYMTYIRGDRSATSANSTTNETVLRTYGTLAQGQKIMNITAGGATYTALANPYAGAIDLKQLAFSNTGAIDVLVWDPKLGGSYTLGGFQYLTRLAPGQDFKISTPGGGSYGGVGTPMNTIESGLAFFVKGSTGAQTVTMNENAKTAALNNVFFNGAQPKNAYALLSIKAGTTTTLVDGANGTFDAAYSNEVDADDVVKMSNASENVSFKRSGSFLAIERRMMPAAEDTLFINLSGLGIKDYEWTIKLTNMEAPGLTGFIKDSYLNTTAALNLNGDNTIDFSVTADPRSYEPDRFMIILKPTGVVAVTLNSISAQRLADKSVKVSWRSENEAGIDHYEIRHSEDGITFSALAVQGATNNAGGTASYSYNDVQPYAGINYYRVKAVSTSGAISYTAVVKLAPANEKASFSVSPNPVKDKLIRLQAVAQAPGDYKVQLINNAGQVVYKGLITVSGSTNVQRIQLPANTAAGNYRLSVTDADGHTQAQSIIIE